MDTQYRHSVFIWKQLKKKLPPKKNGYFINSWPNFDHSPGFFILGKAIRSDFKTPSSVR